MRARKLGVRPGNLAILALGLLLLGAVGCAKQASTTLRLSEFRVSPEQVNVTAGKPVTLALINSGKIEHNWMLDHAAGVVPIQVVLASGEGTSVTFTPEATGTFRYWCTIPGHAPAGMVGTLIVE
jgi:uncharacterized cupredoxin-like copper-binding protein